MNYEIMLPNYLNYMESLPKELEDMINKNPIAYVPFGALEWHGELNVLGVDSIKAAEICRRSAEITGGVLFPCVNYGAFRTMNFPFTFHFSKRPHVKMTRKLVKQLYKTGFKIIILLTGHYPSPQIKQIMKAAKKISKKHDDCFALGIPEQKLIPDFGYFGDHAAKWETSMMMAINPKFVDLERLPNGLTYAERTIRHGVWGIDPKTSASKDLGEKVLNEIVKRLSEAILKVKKTQSIDPFEEIYSKYKIERKKARKDLKNFLQLNGIASKKEGIEIFKWMLFKRKKQNSQYQSKKK
ncbi:MAG: creatininase family protein [Promethearchaeota archaeon]